MADLCKCGALATIVFPGPNKVALCDPCWRQSLREAEKLVDMAKKALKKKRGAGKEVKREKSHNPRVGGPAHSDQCSGNHHL